MKRDCIFPAGCVPLPGQPEDTIYRDLQGAELRLGLGVGGGSGVIVLFPNDVDLPEQSLARFCSSFLKTIQILPPEGSLPGSGPLLPRWTLPPPSSAAL